jgi:hypothetical protein
MIWSSIHSDQVVAEGSDLSSQHAVSEQQVPYMSSKARAVAGKLDLHANDVNHPRTISISFGIRGSIRTRI